jgi:hypothetical protein
MAETKHKRIQFPKKSTTVNVVTISNTEDNMQEAAYKSNKIITESGLTISAQ